MLLITKQSLGPFCYKFKENKVITVKKINLFIYIQGCVCVCVCVYKNTFLAVFFWFGIICRYLVCLIFLNWGVTSIYAESN